MKVVGSVDTDLIFRCAKFIVSSFGEVLEVKPLMGVIIVVDVSLVPVGGECTSAKAVNWNGLGGDNGALLLSVVSILHVNCVVSNDCCVKRQISTWR